MQQFRTEVLAKRKQINTLHLDPWRMNIMQCDLLRMKMYIASEYSIKIINFGDLNINDGENIQISEMDIINQIKIYADSLYIVTMNGYLYIVNLDNYLQIIQLQAQYHDIEDCSLWSLDISDLFIAVGSNSTIITIWSLNQISFERDYQQYLQERELNCQYTLEQFQQKDTLTRGSITQNKHNIPCVAFSQCSKYLCSGSIDKHIRIFLVENGNEIMKLQLSAWVWSLQWNNKKNNKQSQNNIEYQLIVGIQKAIVLVDMQGNKLIQRIEISQSPISGFQRYQTVSYQAMNNLIMAIPQHANCLQFFEIQLIDDEYFYKVWELQLVGEQILGADIKQIEGSNKLLVSTVSFQQIVGAYLLSTTSD